MIKFLKFVKYFVLFLIILILSFYLFLNYYYQFGKIPDKYSQEVIDNSKYFSSGSFINIYDIPKFSPDKKQKDHIDPSLKDWFFPPKDKNPSNALPSISLNKDLLTESKFSWLGHSTILINTNDVVIMTDPVFNRASPIPIIGKPFLYQNITSYEDLPEIDVVIISHDHYDHLDAKTMIEFSKKVSFFIVPLGVKGHLVRWGIDPTQIKELDWYETHVHQGINFTLTPAHHFSGRGISDHNKTLWGSWVIKSKNLNLFFSGDSGYTNLFKEIGDTYGPFDLAFIECGGYNSNWADVHMFPYEVVQAHIDLKARAFIPISWAKFDLSLHSWDEPIVRVTREAKKREQIIGSPMIGEVFDLEAIPTKHWWKNY